MSTIHDADSNDGDQSNRFDADQIGAQRRKAFSVWNSDRHQFGMLIAIPRNPHHEPTANGGLMVAKRDPIYNESILGVGPESILMASC